MTDRLIEHWDTRGELMVKYGEVLVSMKSLVDRTFRLFVVWYVKRGSWGTRERDDLLSISLIADGPLSQ